ncbi:unnamed protein product [Choristocarpus tenellus]
MDHQSSIAKLVASGKAAIAVGDLVTAAKHLEQATKLGPDNPKAWRSLVDLYEIGSDRAALIVALTRCVEIAESKNNYDRSRPLRLHLSEVQEKAGDTKGALATLKAFTSNPAAVAAGGENSAMKQRSTQLFMAMNASMVPPPPPPPPKAPTPAPVSRGIPAAADAVKPQGAWTSPKATAGAAAAAAKLPTVAASAAAFAAASLNESTLSGWVKLAVGKQLQTKDQLQALGDEERLGVLSEHLSVLEETGTADARRVAAVAVSLFVTVSTVDAPWVVAQLTEFLDESGSTAAKEGALLTIQALCEVAGIGAEPHLVPLVPAVLAAHADTAAPVRAAAAWAAAALPRVLNCHGLRVVLSYVIDGVEVGEWRAKAAALDMTAALARQCPVQMASALPEIVPVVSHQVWDTKRQVQTASKCALLAACACIGNPDIEPLVDRLVSVIAKPEETGKTLDALLATTFVTRVDRATLSVIAPLLGKCLRERSSQMRRKASRVIANMARLVTEPGDVAPFIPLLLPALQKAVEETVDSEAAEAAKEALDNLVKALGDGEVAERAKRGICGPSTEEVEALKGKMIADLERVLEGASRVPEKAAVEYVGALCACLVLYGVGDAGPSVKDNWCEVVLPYLTFVMPQAEAEKIYEEFLGVAKEHLEGEGEDDDALLCDIEFSLAYGGKILLHNTPFRIKAGHRYSM